MLVLPHKLGRQNLAALSAAAGKNLAAVGSSHSLAETVDLGTVTVAGLVGTLHSDTPPQNQYARQPEAFRPQRNNGKVTIIGHAMVL